MEGIKLPAALALLLRADLRGARRSLNKDAPVSRPVQRTGVISSAAILGALHHHYARA
jgi:hypothetical protein